MTDFVCAGNAWLHFRLVAAERPIWPMPSLDSQTLLIPWPMRRSSRFPLSGLRRYFFAICFADLRHAAWTRMAGDWIAQKKESHRRDGREDQA
ncbi:hypothetical protein [Pseudogulbenkiania ferrooxidans]|uniref:hypothetical protein n=1 Tax=Pseudogulbenkiania ferrooxidans TaxID=549169 RepID=UPI001269021F|nr:hypothetical protein [Pseudogulbenkiania ferrooxidans]